MNTITVDGKEYEPAALSESIKKLISIHNKWNADLDDLRMELAKTEAAIRDLSREIIEVIAAEAKSVEQ